MSQMLEEEAAAQTRVRNADRMDKETFCLHMTHRHSDSLGGLAVLLPDHMTDYVEECWRRFHERLHAVRIDLDHYHART
jgi:hypothetical protein